MDKNGSSTSTKGVSIPEGEWLTLREGAAYARMSYQNFTQVVARKDIPSYRMPGYSRRKLVKKADIDTVLLANPV